MTWRWVFWVSTIGCGVALILLILCYHPPHYDQLHTSGRHTIRKQLRELDYVGIFLFVAGLTLLLLPISWGGTLYPWKSAATIATLIIGVLLLVALGLWETYKTQPIPLMPISFFRNIGFMSIVLVASSGACVYYPATLLWPQQVAKQYGITGQHAGWLACTVGGATSAGTSGGGLAIWLVGGKSRGLLIFLSLVMVSLIAALAAQGLDGLLLGTVLTSFGPVFSGLIESISLGLAPLFCPPQDLGLAAGMLGTIRSAVASIASKWFTISTVISVVLFKQILTKCSCHLHQRLPDTSLDHHPPLRHPCSRAGWFPGVKHDCSDFGCCCWNLRKASWHYT